MKRNLMLIVAMLSSMLRLPAQTLTLDARHLLLDGSLTDDDVRGRDYVYNNVQEAMAHLHDTTTLYIRPWVYWVDNPDEPAVVTGRDGREPFGMTIRTRRLTLVGLGDDPRDVVLASQRGQTQGAVGNFTMLDFHVDYLEVTNMTLGNYCNVDLDYPQRPELSRRKRSDAITQAHVGYVDGDSLMARRVRFVSRLNLNPLNGARHSLYDSCHFECTDDALNGGHAVYRHCDFDLYGAKPLWSTFGAGPMFIDCDFYVRSDNRETYFCKQGGPVTVVDCRYHAPQDSYVGWTAYPQPWLRCYEHGFTLNGEPYVIGARQPQNTVILDAAPRSETPFLHINCHEARLLTGGAPLVLRCAETVSWRVSGEGVHGVKLSATRSDSVVVIPDNQGNSDAELCVVATTDDGREAACHIVVGPRHLPAPTFLRKPRLKHRKGRVWVDYALELGGRDDMSAVEWLRDGITVSTAPVYVLTAADNGHRLSAVLRPKLNGSDEGEAVVLDMKKSVKGIKVSRRLDTDFHDLPCQWQPQVKAGYWTVDGYKPADTSSYPWSFDRNRPMWTYGEGFNGAVGYGLLQAQRGARLMYTPVSESCGNMSLVLLVDPTKTAGQGFGSATGQYMDVCLKFDTRTLTGYGLRIERTVKHAKAVDFQLVAYRDGHVSALTAPVSSTCYRTGCTIALSYADGRLEAHVQTVTPQPSGSDLPHEVSLSTVVPPLSFGGIHIQHTGSCGESTTMFHRLQAEWE